MAWGLSRTSSFGKDLEAPQGKRPLVAENPRGGVYDACVMEVEDQAEFYGVAKVAVKKHSDKLTIGLQIDVDAVLADAPNKFFSWGINVSRQRLAGDTPEYYLLSPGGRNGFMPWESIGNLLLRK
ncbi:MAG: hypothetical protein HY736_00745 [Verrucomicrobia bacterium]|nr:hypothetical protein [Verrucomicrobiota bacterium]